MVRQTVPFTKGGRYSPARANSIALEGKEKNHDAISDDAAARLDFRSAPITSMAPCRQAGRIKVMPGNPRPEWISLKREGKFAVTSAIASAGPTL